MSRKSENTKIGSNEYTVTMMPARQAARNKVFILGALAANLKGLKLGADKNDKGAMGALGIDVLASVIGGLDEETTDSIIERLLKDIAVNDGTTFEPLLPKADDIFAGKLSEMYTLMRFVLEVNYPDFLGQGTKGGAVISKLVGTLKQQTLV